MFILKQINVQQGAAESPLKLNSFNDFVSQTHKLRFWHPGIQWQNFPSIIQQGQKDGHNNPLL